jgi:chromosome segregation ATPase
MSSRAPGGVQPGPAQTFRQEDDRQRNEARILGLHTMVDELRQAMRELASRQVRLDELIKQLEAQGQQNRLAIEQIGQDMNQSAQARILDENRTRQVIADFDAQLDDITRPLRALQSQVHELAEAARRKTDDSGLVGKRFEEFRVQLEDVRSLADRSVAMAHGLRESIEATNDETDGIRRELMRTDDQIKMVDQDMRRRIAEVSSSTEGYNSRFDELRSDIAHAFELIEHTRRVIAPFEPAIEELREKDGVLRQDITRYAGQSTERIEAVMERLDAVVQDVDGRFGEIKQSHDQRFERISERIEQAEELHRQMTYRLSSLVNELEGLRQVDDGLQRELWVLHEQRVRLRLEQVQQELEYLAKLRRDVDQDAPATAPRQRRPEF